MAAVVSLEAVRRFDAVIVENNSASLGDVAHACTYLLYRLPYMKFEVCQDIYILYTYILNEFVQGSHNHNLVLQF